MEQGIVMVIFESEQGRAVALFDSDGAASHVVLEGNVSLKVGELEEILSERLEDDYRVSGKAETYQGLPFRFVRVERSEDRRRYKL